MDDYSIKRWVNPAQHFDDHSEIIWELGAWGKPLPGSSIRILEIANELDDLCDCNRDAVVMMKDDEIAYIRMSIGFNY